MKIISICLLILIIDNLDSFFPTSIRKFAASVGSKILPEKRDKKFIDFDTEKLCSHVCINYFVEGKLFENCTTVLILHKKNFLLILIFFFNI